MKTTCLLLTLLFVIGLTACSKSDDPLPEKVFQDVNKTAEDYIGELNPNLYYNFFRFQNDSDHTLYWGINTKFSTIMGLYYCRPGQQATDLITMEYYPGLHDYDILIDNLMAVGWIEFYFDLPAPDDLPDWRVPNEFQDTCAMFLQLWSRTVRKRLPKILHNGNLRSSPIIASAGRTVSRMRIMTKRCDRPKNAGPKKTTGSNRREDVLRRSAGPERLAPGILIFRALKCMISVFPPLQKGAKDPFRPSRGSCRSRTPRGWTGIGVPLRSRAG